MELPGFRLKDVETKPDGRRYMVAENDSTSVVVSLTLESIPAGSSASPCRKSLEQKAKTSPFKVQDVQYSKATDFDVMQYMVPKVAGKEVNQKSVFACRFYDNAYIDLHISKVNFAPADDSLFADVINSMRIDNVQRSSMDFMGEGSRLYLEHDYKRAIGPYSQALEMEKLDPKLDRRLWYVLVDNLGMSYGISGDLNKAKETFEYGVSKDPSYPLFYYNLACTYAEMGNSNEATSYLKKAFDYKANTLPGEVMPDPRQDDSFKKMMKNKEFRELAESLVRTH